MQALITFKDPSTESPTACHQGLGITALSTAMSLREQRLSADALPAANGEHLWAQLAGPWAKYTHVVMEAPFIDAPFLQKLFRQFPGKQFSLVYHSNLGFLSQDGFAGQSLPLYMSLESASHNFTVAGNSEKLTLAMTAATGMPLTWLPNLYHLPTTTRRLRPSWAPAHGTLALGLFGAARALKNWLTAGVAAMIMQRSLDVDVDLHVSSMRDEGAAATRQNLSAILALNQRVHLIEAPWMTHDDFVRYLYGMDLLLQPSFTETHNNVSADGCYCGVPAVVSEAIDWAPPEWVAEADSAVSVAEVGCALLRDRKSAMNGWKALDRFNRRATAAWNQWLGVAG